MTTFGLDFIYGVTVGIEFADAEVKSYFPELVWGVSIDLFIIRITIYNTKE